MRFAKPKILFLLEPQVAAMITVFLSCITRAWCLLWISSSEKVRGQMLARNPFHDIRFLKQRNGDLQHDLKVDDEKLKKLMRHYVYE